ncbi:MAG: hypothetical protein HY721_01235, partial [Planctomycetes bacterium]|nr:hypothetical protein [Planctomycetota bacterium]
IEGVRAAWEPRPVRADVRRCAFLEREPFRGAAPVLASAFHLQGVPYLWERGVLHPLERAAQRSVRSRAEEAP